MRKMKESILLWWCRLVGPTCARPTREEIAEREAAITAEMVRVLKALWPDQPPTTTH
jgi:hypothetical protein